jgi:acetyltransferase-like isoleucine patch superfamily enzyme/dTDP-4-dehydrorhamnose 3,5-epimerase-like enzyme
MTTNNHRNVHPSSLIEEGVAVHETALIGPNCYLRGRMSIGANAHLKGGLTLIGDIHVGHDAFIEPGVCIASDANKEPPQEGKVVVCEGAHVGAGCVLYQGVVIGRYARIEPGSVIFRNIPPYAVVSGNPAVITGYVRDTSQQRAVPITIVEKPDAPGVYPFNVRGVALYQFQRIRDLRGDLTVGEFERNIPFIPKRYFVVFDVPSYETRGEHAHKRCHQFLICPSGSVSVVVDDGVSREEITLNKPNMGLLIPARVWGVQYKYSAGSALIVFASEYYDPDDYIRNYDEFVKFCELNS